MIPVADARKALLILKKASKRAFKQERLLTENARTGETINAVKKLFTAIVMVMGHRFLYNKISCISP
jgi:hypothetical protein